jgi:hypothetical protein
VPAGQRLEGGVEFVAVARALSEKAEDSVSDGH